MQRCIEYHGSSHSSCQFYPWNSAPLAVNKNQVEIFSIKEAAIKIEGKVCAGAIFVELLCGCLISPES